MRVMGLITSTGTRILSTRSSWGQSCGQTARLSRGTGSQRGSSHRHPPDVTHHPAPPAAHHAGPLHCCPFPAPSRQAEGQSTPCPESLRHSPRRLTPTPPSPAPVVQTPSGPLSRGGILPWQTELCWLGVLSHFGLPIPFPRFQAAKHWDKRTHASSPTVTPKTGTKALERQSGPRPRWV